MRSLEFTLLAREDLKEIYKYIGRRNRSGAKRVAGSFNDLFLLLLNQPRLGRTRFDLRAGLRSVPVGNYIIYYMELDQKILIYRVLHVARDIEAVFDEED